MFGPNNVKPILNSDQVNTIIGYLRSNQPSYAAILTILRRNFNKMQKEAPLFETHKALVRTAVDLLTNDQHFKSTQNEDDDAELLSIEDFLREKLSNPNVQSSHMIQQCLDQIQLYVNYYDELYGKKLQLEEKPPESEVSLSCKCNIF